MSENRRFVGVIVCNHFDPIWRRCWDRRFEFKGNLYASYADIQSYYMLDALALARQHPDYRFEAESTLVLRQFLHRHPERLDELRALAAEGRFAVAGAGENIIDCNMVLGESMVRNWLLGLLWVEQHLGTPCTVGARYDGFGNGAQLPQILCGVELPWTIGFCYSPVRGDYWRGLDGSVVCTARPAQLDNSGGFDKYPPCRQCGGEGCEACEQRGIDTRALPARLPRTLGDAERTGEPAFVMAGPEELVPNPALIDWVAQHRQRGFDVSFTLHEDHRRFVQDRLDARTDPPADRVHPGVELNPNSSGVWVGRIRLKQMCRRQEYALLAAETLSALAARAGGRYARAELDEAWRTLLLTMFHDALTATHVDPAYDELLDMGRQIDALTDRVRQRALAKLTRPAKDRISVLNPYGQAVGGLVEAVVEAGPTGVRLSGPDGRAVPVVGQRTLDNGQVAVEFVARPVAALSAERYRVAPRAKAAATPKALATPTIENERFRVTADAHGLLAIHDRRLGRDVAATLGYRPNDIVLERDEGSPWETRSPDRPRTPLAPHTTLLGAQAGEGFQRLSFGIANALPFSLGTLQGQATVTLYEGLDRVDFRLDIDWDSFNQRVRVAMPVPVVRGRLLYGIAYGQLERRPYTPTWGRAGGNGDWPAINWAGVEGPGLSVALLSRGLPSYAIEPGPASETILLSVLRSPTLPAFLHEPEHYTMTDYDGMRDAGRHSFAYALTAYDTPFAASPVTLEAEGFNAPLLAVAGEVALPDRPTVQSPNVRLAALKLAEQGRGLILRLAEFRGLPGRATVTVPPDVKRVLRTNLLERQGQSLDVRDAAVSLELRPWEIATLRMEP